MTRRTSGATPLTINTTAPAYTVEYAFAEIGVAVADLAKLQTDLAKRMEADFDKAFGVMPQVPGVIEPVRPPCGCGPVLHRAGCRYGGWMT